MLVGLLLSAAVANGEACGVPSVGMGTCMDTTKCVKPYQSYPGHCSGAANIQCCVYPHDPAKHQPKQYLTWCEANGKTSHDPYLSDIYCMKTFPSKFDREFKCPNKYDSASLEGYSPTSTIPKIHVNTTALKPYTSADFLVSVVLIRRDSSGNAFYKYLSNGNERKVVQPWSSSKVFASINAGATMRTKCTDPIGLDSTENNKHDPLGDLITIIHSYDSTQGMQSNCLAGYMHNIGGRNKINDVLHSWLGAPSTESLGGNYGCTTTYGLGNSFTAITNKSKTCTLPVEPVPGIPNQLSMLTASEFYKRLIMTREEPNNAYPGSKWADVREIMYGPATSTLFPGLQWGGGSADTAWYLQSGVDIAKVENASHGDWRIFSKLGAGCETGCDIVSNSYACFPQLDAKGVPVLNKGVEFVLSAWYHANTELATDTGMQANIAKIVAKIYDGTLA